MQQWLFRDKYAQDASSVRLRILRSVATPSAHARALMNAQSRIEHSKYYLAIENLWNDYIKREYSNKRKLIRREKEEKSTPRSKTK